MQFDESLAVFLKKIKRQNFQKSKKKQKQISGEIKWTIPKLNVAIDHMETIDKWGTNWAQFNLLYTLYVRVVEYQLSS